LDDVLKPPYFTGFLTIGDGSIPSSPALKVDFIGFFYLLVVFAALSYIDRHGDNKNKKK